MNSLTIVLAGLFLLTVGFFAIGIYLTMRPKKKDSEPRDEPEAKSKDEELRERGIREVLRLLRNEESGTLLLEKNGVIYRAAEDLSPEQRRAFSIAVGDLRAWLGLSPSPQEEPTADRPVQSVKPGEATGTRTPLQSRLKAASQGSVDEPIKAPSMNPVEVFTRAIASDVPKASFESKSITAQIDEILQERLVGTPLDQRGIRLLDSPDGGVVVFVGIENYDGVDAVPDEEVRRAIRAAVTEWEQRSSQRI
jgi:hypothetical protein